MPSLRRCIVDGCPAMVRGGTRCADHAGWPTMPPMPRGWESRRKAKLERNPYCEVSTCLERATTVDHILARAFGGGEDPSNLRSLCPTHASKKDQADRERGKRR